MPPRVPGRDGRLFVEAPEGIRLLPVARVVFHGIFEDDLDLLAALALWGGPCYPGPLALLDCRLRLPCLARALRLTRFGAPPRGYASGGVEYPAEAEQVAKWGNWHCGENKARFTGRWVNDEPCLIEPFLPGEAVRVVILGDRAWQIRLAGEGWLKSVHGPGAALMEADPELVADTRAVQAGLRLTLLANDYMVTAAGKHLLEVNHIPSVTCFPELWQAYEELVVNWATSATG
jgi:hypothetical protein